MTTRCSKAATQAPRPGLYTLAVKSYVANKRRTAGIGRNPVHTDTKESEMGKKRGQLHSSVNMACIEELVVLSDRGEVGKDML